MRSGAERASPRAATGDLWIFVTSGEKVIAIHPGYRRYAGLYYTGLHQKEIDTVIGEMVII